MSSAMPEGAFATHRSATKAAPARERAKLSAYFGLSKKLTSSGPALSSGATSTNRRAPSSGRNRRAPLRAANVNGPARSKKRGSAISPLALPAAPVSLPPASGRARAGGGGRRRKTDGQRRQLLIKLLQYLVSNFEFFIKKYQIRTWQYQICFSLFCNICNNLQNRLLNFCKRLTIGFFKSLAFAFNAAIKRIDFFLKFSALLVQGLGGEGGLLALQRVALGPQRLFLPGDFPRVLQTLLFDLAAHHLGGFAVLQ